MSNENSNAHEIQPNNSSESDPGQTESATKERLMRVSAELDNLRKRSKRDLEEQRKYSEAGLLQDLLPVVDNLRHAIDATEIASNPDDMLQGIRMIYEQLEDVLKRHHCELIEAEGQPFDPEIHEAVRQVATSDEGENTVLDVVQPGYRLHDRVLRPSRVVVSSKPNRDADSSS